MAVELSRERDCRRLCLALHTCMVSTILDKPYFYYGLLFA